MCIRDRRESERERERERETDRQTDTETETETDRQTDRQREEQLRHPFDLKYIYMESLSNLSSSWYMYINRVFQCTAFLSY